MNFSSELFDGVVQRAEMSAGTGLPMVLAKEGTILGLLTLSSIVRGAFQNAILATGSTMPPKVRG
jgi:hypothetical protein